MPGLYAYEALASVLIRRLRFGGGEAIEVTLAGAMAAFLAPRIATHVLSAGRAGPAGFMAPTGDYRTAEGLLTLAVLAPDGVARLCAALGRPDWLEDPRFATPAARLEHAAALRAEVQALLATRTAVQWEADLAGRGLMACRVRDIAGFLQSQAGDGLDLVDSVQMPGLGDCPLVNIPGAPRWAGRDQPPRAPALGEHSREILQEAGIGEALIGRLAG